MTARYARVVVDSRLPQLDRLFEYRVPPALEGVAPGVRVRVPLRGDRTATGYVVEVADARAWEGEVADVEAVVSPVPVLRPEVWALARAVADRAAGGAADVLRVAIPGRQARVEKAWLARAAAGAAAEAAEPAATEGAELTETDASPEPDAPPESPAPLEPDDASAPLLPGLVEARRKVALECAGGVAEVPVAGGGTAWVGRWAVALAGLARQAVERGEQAILVVPDHREQRQLRLALEAAVGEERVVELDARQRNPERYAGFLRCVDGGGLAIIGPRSAVYAPAADLGLLVVWEDGDPLLAEPLSPWVHARDAALVRQGQTGCALVIAGHARSTDAERLVEVGFLEHERVGAHRVRVLPTALADDGRRVPAAAFHAAREALASRPVLVQVARPGHAPGLRCGDCGTRARCAACGGPLGQRTRGAQPGCRLCGRLAAAWRCPSCHGARLVEVGRGSTRIAEELGRAMPGVPVVVADGEHERLTIDARPRIVVATRGAEPVADGGYGAVLLLDGDSLLAREGLRVAEEAVRQWATARALAAEGATVVLAGVIGPTVGALTGDTTVPFAKAELAERRSLRFPPAVRTASVVGHPDAVAEALEALAGIEHLDVLGPVPAEGAPGDRLERAIVRFAYADGAHVAGVARGRVLAAAARPRKPGAPPRLRIRLDDPEPFDGL
ncbi:primosomal protein N' [Agrococcus sp. SCSIO52902]|uniref:primosomal protein N' family DNA-binding protein n=1 Tax=Agrococcus sp. SCSIO52902 TaxID=2933290 RepID=UPI001FF4FE4E|nr:primosomal protein N' [Agrococcus sp. SCSIO52902]UOW00510.1 primosomal protein N' [Agrococcus sp. SCSIO52902]